MKMEDELRCYACRGFYANPVILPCSHSICFPCVLAIQVSGPSVLQPGDQQQQQQQQQQQPNSAQYDFSFDFPEADRLSAFSDGDSGVSFAGGYAPSQASGTSSSSGTSSGLGVTKNGYTSANPETLRISCPQCHRTIFLDEKGVNGFPRNRVLESIVSRYGKAQHLIVKCQLCEQQQNAADASVYCEQCEVFYCSACRLSCHPARGPLAKHSLVSPAKGSLKAKGGKSQPKIATCQEHADENLSMFCMLCKIPVCYVCQNEGKHVKHEMKALGAMAKSQKTELSQALTSLSEKAKCAKDFLVNLKNTIDHVQESSVDFEASLVAKFDELINVVQKRKEQLILQVQREKEFKTKMLKNHIGQCSSKLKQTTGLLEYSIEVMKEGDPAAFLMVSEALVQRAQMSEESWDKELLLQARVAPEFDLTLDSAPAVQAIERLNFKEMKRVDMNKAPEAPSIIPSDCSAENNSVTIAWQAHLSSWVEGYVLELDDGNNGEFREVYCGRETMCTVDGLHFDSTYHARVKAYNHAGEGDYSETICLQTAEVAWFHPDPRTAHPDIIFNNENMTLSCNNQDDRVVLGNVGFSKGVHYWEVTIDRYDKHPDPAFGVARLDTCKDAMLGKDEKSWSMYIDSNRSWFIHNNAHSDRCEGGIGVGSVVGVLLDLEKRVLCFYVNDKPQGPVAFKDMKGVFFPAFSLNHNVQITVHPGLEVPTDFD
ncbi:E3 ubiquitin-protein ligase TRIM9-like [Diadema antillarum]|uniref:E3 ubiquitin-protein ligase TRIM9-like n=1 Tax=Diadema antillarum TaxID=105358 RepID=UPI003A8BF620